MNLGNHKGRQPGTPNRITKELRQCLKNILSDELERIPVLLNELPPRDRIELITKLLPYAMPKVQPETYELSESAWE